MPSGLFPVWCSLMRGRADKEKAEAKGKEEVKMKLLEFQRYVLLTYLSDIFHNQPPKISGPFSSHLVHFPRKFQ